MYKTFKNNFFLLLFLIIFLVISVASIFRQSLGFDEIVDLQEGRNAILYHTFNIDPYNTPLTREIGVLPYVFTKDFYKSERYVLDNPLPGRLGITILGALLLVSTYFFTKKFFGKSVAIFATFLLTFEPTFLANSHLLTMDTSATLFFLLSIWMAINFLEKPTKKNLFFLGVAIGLGCASKISFIPFFAVSILGIFVYRYIKTKKHTPIKFWNTLSLVVIILITIWSTYFFNWHVVIKERTDSNRVSEKILTYSKEHNVPVFATLVTFGKTQPIPLGDFLATIKNNALRSSAPKCFFLGTYYASCKWYFILINFLLKIPIIFIILIISSIGTLHVSKNKNLYIIGIPIIALFVIAMATDKVYPFVRYLLPMYPFLAILSAITWPLWQKKIGTKILLAGLCLWYVVSTFFTFPNFLGYANEFAGNPNARYLILTDNNLDWGQNLPAVKKYIDENRPHMVRFSYFGRDNADLYGLQSTMPYGSYKNNEICEFHAILTSHNTGKDITIISSSNWWFCGYYKQKQFAKNNIKDVIAQTILVF